MNRRLLFSFALALVAVRPFAFANDESGVEFFEARIRPVLINYCYECHSAAAPELKGGLRLDSREFIRRGGESGPAVVPGDLAQSLLLSALRHNSLEMPPDQKLPKSIIEDFVTWIESGAPDPRNHPPTASEASEASWSHLLAQRQDWWSLQPVNAPGPPKGAAHPIDAFIGAKQQAKGILPATSANAQTLLRRLSLVLTGLPPNASEIGPFVRDYTEDPDAAYRQQVDRLLTSPHFGEHWARHWMDVVRFSETHGYEWNHEIRDAWRFRDYLIRAFNNDLPFDQLIREHIAGDLIDPPRVDHEQGINESLIGTAFWRFGELGHDDCVQYPEIRFDALDNQIDTFSKAFQGLTVSCARCHDHKLDPISTKDYYAMVAVLENCAQVVHTLDSPNRLDQVTAEIQELKSELRLELGNHWLTSIETLGEKILAALHEKTGDKQPPNLIVSPKKNQKLQRQNPAYVLAQFVSRPDETASEEIASRWQKLAQEYQTEHRRRKQVFSEKFEQWMKFRVSGETNWSTTGLGLDGGPNRAGDFVVKQEGDEIVETVLSAGIHTHTLSDRLNGSLRSPWLPIDKKYISIQLPGNRRSMVRTVVDSCGLNEFAGGGLHYLDGGRPEWKTFPTSAGPGLRSFIELTTRSDNPRWPDRPGRAGSADPKLVYDYRSSFGVMQAVLHDEPAGPEPDLRHMVRLFDTHTPEQPSDLAAAFQQIAHNVVTAWQAREINDADVQWLNWCLQVGLLPNVMGNLPPRLSDLITHYRQLSSTIDEPRVVAGLADHGERNGFPVLIKGDPKKPGAIVPPRYLEVIAGKTRFESPGSGRLQLAAHIATPANPLTARVLVNRVWHHLFGRGIVSTPDDFGRMGEFPSHPELLDHLATEFTADGWSIKRLIKRIVLSNTFRQTSIPDSSAVQIDPDNRLLHHYPARRLDGEAIRDTLLAVSGRWDPMLYGPSIHPHRANETDYRKLFVGPLDGDGRRSIYTKVTRMEGPRFLESFDFPNRMVTRGRRDRTNVPAQALAMLNDPFVIDQAAYWARHLTQTKHPSTEARIEAMFLRAVGRSPSADELTRFIKFVRSLGGKVSANDTMLLQNIDVWQDAAHAIFNMKELVYIL